MEGQSKETPEQEANLVGGFGESQPATEEIQDFCDQVKEQAEAANGVTYSQFKAISYRQQVVAGMNYLVKVDIGNGEEITIKIFKGLGNAAPVYVK